MIGYSSASLSGQQLARTPSIFMENEYFNIEVEFLAHETEHNMDRAIYLTTKLSSYKPL
jgi:hypothetical protein